jgi:hypothetical protein
VAFAFSWFSSDRSIDQMRLPDLVVERSKRAARVVA